MTSCVGCRSHSLSHRGFWIVYFMRTGANLKSYSPLRDAPDLGP
jgi:hypothetical protein